MPENQKQPIGAVSWRDLTVVNADAVRDSYCQVVGWKSQPLSMGDYDDYCMNLPGSGETVAGVCHAREPNVNLPPQWLMYITVADVDAAAETCRRLGGKVLDGPRAMGGQRFCLIKDPAGAVAALISQ